MAKQMKHEESNIQQTFIQWCNLMSNQHQELAFIHHSPNGGKRNAREGARFKREGVKAGFPDLILPVANQEYHGLFIEVKTKTGRLTDTQKKWRSFLENKGYMYQICRSVDDCIKCVKEYLKIRK